MNRGWEIQGNCSEKNLSEVFALIPFDSTKCYIAFLTDKFKSGKFTENEIITLDAGKLLEIRIFDDKQELLIQRSMIGLNHLFSYRIASEENLSEDEYMVGRQTLDIDHNKIKQLPNGNLSLLTTGGGNYELPISLDEDSIRIITYIDYDEDGMAFIYDNRLAGFEKM